MTHKALVIGGQGVLGRFIADELSAAGWQTKRAGRRREDAADFRLIDLDDPADIRQACAEVDLVVNTAHHPELTPERTVLREGGTLIDLIEIPRHERARLVSEEPGARGLIVADTGLGGVAYLTIADLLRAHPEADGAEYSLMISASGSTGRAGALFAHRLLTASSHHRTARIPLPAPIGSRRGIEIGADDASVLRQAVGEVPVRHYICMQPRALQGLLLVLNAARLMSALPAASFTAGAGKAPSRPSDEPVCEWVAVTKDGRRLAARTLAGRGYYRMTAAATVAFAEALAASTTGRRGLLSIDELVTLGAVGPALERHRIAIDGQPLDPGEVA